MIVIFSIDLYKTKRNTFTLKCFTQSTGTNLDDCQKEGVTFLICFRKSGGGGGVVPRKGGSLRKGEGGSPTLEETMLLAVNHLKNKNKRESL